MTAKSPIRPIACLTLCLWAGFSVRVHAEIREVSIAEVVREFCAVVVEHEGDYVKLIEACFPDASQDSDTRDSCRAVINSVTRVMNEFFTLRESLEVKNHYRVPYDWTPPPDAFERLKCQRSEGRFTSGVWHCPGLNKEQVQIASREPVCADAFMAEDRIGSLIGNANRADQLLTIKSLRVTTEKAGPVVSPEWSIKGGDRAD